MLKLPLPFIVCAAALTAQQSPEAEVRRALTAKSGVVTLPAGTIEISREIDLPPDAHDLEIKGDGTVIVASSTFRGRALLTLPGGRNIHIHDISIDGTAMRWRASSDSLRPAHFIRVSCQTMASSPKVSADLRSTALWPGT